MPDVNPIPTDYPRVSPGLVIDGAADAIEFYKEVLGAEERMRVPGPNGTVGHAELVIGDSLIMLGDEWPDMGLVGPDKLGGSAVGISVYVEDVDATFARAIAGGATEFRPVEDQFYGDRSGQFVDPWGHRWGVASHVRDVSEAEMAEAAEAMAAEQEG